MTQKERVLQLLTDAGPDGVTSNRFFRECLPRFSARLHELKADGYLIEKEPIDAGFFLYRLTNLQPGTSRPAEPPATDSPPLTAVAGNSSVPGGEGFSCDGDSPRNPRARSSYYAAEAQLDMELAA